MSGRGERRVQPLMARPDAFEAALARADRRRRRKAAIATISCVAAVTIAGTSVSLGGVPSSLERNRMPADGNTSKAPDPTTGPAGPLAPGGDSSALDRKSSLSAGGGPRPATEGQRSSSVARPRLLRGLVVDTAGQPVSGAYVYQGSFTQGRFAPGSGFAMTGPDGRFNLTCTHGPVLITPWPINVPTSAARLAESPSWAARFLGENSTFPNPAPCSKQRKQTVVQPGAVVEAKTTVEPTGCQEVGRLRLRLNGNVRLSLVVNGLADNGSVRLPGVPAGTHALNSGLEDKDVSVAGGDVTKDIKLGCRDPGPTESPSPSSPPPSTETPDPPPPPPPSSPATNDSPTSPGPES